MIEIRIGQSNQTCIRHGVTVDKWAPRDAV